MMRLPGTFSHTRYSTRELSLPSVDDDEVRKVPLLNSLDRPTQHDLTMGSEVIDLSDIGKCLDIILSIPARIRFSIHDDGSTRDGELPIGMRDIITLEYDLSLFRDRIAEFLEDIDHMLPREDLILEGCELRLIGIFPELVQGKGKELIFGS